MLRLKGPFASFGLIAGEEVRRTGDFPARSMVVGLIGNALGLDRCEPGDMEKLEKLQATTRFAVLCLSLGPVWEDVQNARVPALAVDAGVPSGRDNLFISSDPCARAERGGRLTDDPVLFGPKTRARAKLKAFLEKPVQRRKQYVTDAHFLVALSPIEGWRLDPEELVVALRHPARPLWLGRKACPPAAPVCPLQALVEAASGPGALARGLVAETCERDALARREGEPPPLLWESSPEPESSQAVALGIKGGFPTRVLDRRDWRRGLHSGESVLYRGTMTPSAARSDAI